LLPIATICVNKKISYKYGEDIAESSETNVGCENVIVIWVEKLSSINYTRSDVIPAA